MAEGVQWSDGAVTIRWCVDGKPQSTVNWDSVEDAEEIHGQDNKTQIVWDF